MYGSCLFGRLFLLIKGLCLAMIRDDEIYKRGLYAFGIYCACFTGRAEIEILGTRGYKDG